MHNYIPAPAAGDPLRASWARDVTAVCNSVAAVASAPGSLVRDGAGAFGHEQMPANMRDRAVGRTYPFKFSRATVNNADAWIVYLTASSLVIDGTAVNVAAGLSAAGTPYAAGWYVSGIPFATGDTTVYLSIAYNITSSGNTYSGVSLRTSPQTDTSAMHYVNIIIAYLNYTATPSSATIRQNIIGAIALSSGGGGGSGIDATVEFYKDLAYSTSTHEFTAKKVTMTFVRGLLTSHTVDQTATVIFTATPHSAEHS